MARSQIIKDLANSNCDLSTALKRTKVLIKLLGDEQILKWINCEIEGYKEENKIPKYRMFLGEFVGTYIVGTMRQHVKYSNVSIPLGKMPKEQRNMLLTASMKQGISTLEQMLKDPNTRFAKNVPTDIYRSIENFVCNPLFSIAFGEVVYDKMQIMDIIPHVENILLDMLLLLEKEFGNLDEFDIDVDSKDEEQLDNIRNTLYVMVFNDNSVTVGNDNKFRDTIVAANIEEK